MRRILKKVHQTKKSKLWPIEVIVVVLFFLVVFSLTFFSLRKIFSQEGGRVLLTKAATQVIKEDNAKNRYTINVEYPEVLGLDNLVFQQYVNEEIKIWVEKEIDQFKKDNENPLKIKALKDAKSQLTISYSVSRLDARILSLALEKYQYNIGQAHGTTSTVGFNYSVKDLKKLLLGDLFKQNVNYLQTLSKISEFEVVEDLEKGGEPADKELVARGTAPKEENFRTFLIDKENLILVFNPYQVAAGSFSTRKISIPFSQIQKVLKASFL